MKTHNWLSRRSFYFLIFLIPIFASLISSCRATRINLDSELQALKQADKNWADACGSKNVDRMLDFYDIDACNIDPQGNVHRGNDELRKLWTDEFATPDYLLTWQLNEAFISKAGDIGYTIGAWNMKFTSQAGKQVNYHGTYLAIWKKQPDGRWKVLVDKS
jgi:ketosteroid isomerase-like protein